MPESKWLMIREPVTELTEPNRSILSRKNGTTGESYPSNLRSLIESIRPQVSRLDIVDFRPRASRPPNLCKSLAIFFKILHY